MDKIIVLDFGGQYAHLIAKRFRSIGYYTEIALPEISIDKIGSSVKGIVLSGSPSSVYDEKTPDFNNELLTLDIPILGLCYGHQIMMKEYGGTVEKAIVGEYGFATLEKVDNSVLFEGISLPAQVWMSHSDEVTSIGKDFRIIGSTKDCKYSAIESTKHKRFGFQFHAEVTDTPIGLDIFANFAKFCGMEKNWDSSKVLDLILTEIREAAGDKKVLLFLSGGVDSSVAFGLLNKALGTDKVLGLYINNGFMRKDETQAIDKRYREAGYENFIIEDGESRFLKAVEGEVDPQKKRHAIGETFITVRDDLVKKMDFNEDEWLLAQGTLYPDIIESGGTKHSNVIKTHHNRVKGIQELIEKGLIIEPLKELYKDEVRKIGKFIGLTDELINRHPFPGPGISINLLCSNGKFYEHEKFDATAEKLSKLKLERYDNYKLYPLPVKSVGVQGDFRTYTYPAVLDFGDFFRNHNSWDVLEKTSSFITNSIEDVNRTIVKLFQKKECKLVEGYCTKDRLDMIRDVDAIVLEELKNAGWYDKIFQHLTINIPYASSTNSCSIVLRPVVSEDVMTARFAQLDLDLLKRMVNRIEKLNFVDALFYDITNKPPATFGWE